MDFISAQLVNTFGRHQRYNSPSAAQRRLDFPESEHEPSLRLKELVLDYFGVS